MPIVKPIDGHTRCVNVRRYLTRKNRALAADYLNLDAPITGYREGLPAYGAFDWALEMDQTRVRHGNHRPWRGRPARTYKHYVISPDPADNIDLPSLRALAVTWASKHFPDHQVAIVYHDDNERGIPHAHAIVNNTNLETGRRLQVPDPKALNRSMQRMAADRGLRAFDNVERSGNRAQGERQTGKRRPPRTLQKVHIGRAESELSERGEYSWVADIRARVDVARGTATSEAEFKELLAALGVTVADNSPKARRPDWLYALADMPTRRVSGEKLGLLYGKEAMQRRFSYGGARMDEADRETVAGIARNAIELNDLDELKRLAAAVALIDRIGARSVADLDRAIARGEADAADPAVAAARESGILPAKSRPRRHRRPTAAAAGPKAIPARSATPQAGSWDPAQSAQQQLRSHNAARGKDR